MPVSMILGAVKSPDHFGRLIPFAGVLLLSAIDGASMSKEIMTLEWNGRMEQRSVKLLPFRDRHDAPLLILLVSVSGRIQYQVFTLWNEGVSDYYYGDDEYLHLAKVLSEKKVYLTLEAAKDGTENALRMSVYSNGNEYQRNITFRGGSEFKWIEPLISGVEDIGNDDDQYITAIAHEWMVHIASWLDDDKNLHENREHQVQLGPDFPTDKANNDSSVKMQQTQHSVLCCL